MAYATLGVVCGNMSQSVQQRENLTKAFDLKDRASERKSSTYPLIITAKRREK